MDDATSVSEVVAGLSISFFTVHNGSLKFGNRFFSVLGSVSAEGEVKHKSHNHLILDSAKKVNNDVLSWWFFCLRLFGMFFGVLLLCGWWFGFFFLIVGIFKNSNHKCCQMS